MFDFCFVFLWVQRSWAFGSLLALNCFINLGLEVCDKDRVLARYFGLLGSLMNVVLRAFTACSCTLSQATSRILRINSN